jgi:long-chain acyl-CoA synthetase
MFPAIKKKISPNLKALICGSAALSVETQLFFIMLGIPVLQVYGLTETTAICTMDMPGKVEPGRVGPAIEGIEMKLGPGDEILVKGPNLFRAYWNRPEATSDVLRDGWFHTGDQGEVDARGNWRITGRIKNLIVLSSGHNVAPEALEEVLAYKIPAARQVVVIGNGRSFLSAIVTGDVTGAEVERAIEEMNGDLPHYKRLRAFYIHAEPFTIENGLLTANGKLKRDLIAERCRERIEELYAEHSA